MLLKLNSNDFRICFDLTFVLIDQTTVKFHAYIFIENKIWLLDVTFSQILIWDITFHMVRRQTKEKSIAIRHDPSKSVANCFSDSFMEFPNSMLKNTKNHWKKQNLTNGLKYTFLELNAPYNEYILCVSKYIKFRLNI